MESKEERKNIEELAFKQTNFKKMAEQRRVYRVLESSGIRVLK
jgi:hypothetical protein